jgi:DNA mismatch repair protein MutS
MTIVEPKISPMMLQWQQCKEEAKDAILLFRLGDFYEAFHEDAETCAKELELTLTQRQGTPMSGIPAHAAESYITKLVQLGYKVAVAEQIEDPKQTKGLVKRAITRIVTSGTLTSGELSAQTNHYIASIAQVGSSFGLAFFDLSTSDFMVTEVSEIEQLRNEICRFRPKELLVSHKCLEKQPHFFDEIKRALSIRIDSLEDWRFEHQLTYGFLTKALKVHSLDGFGLKGLISAINAAGALLAYIQESLHHPLGPIQAIKNYHSTAFMGLDPSTLLNLDLVENSRGGKKQTLLSVIDFTETSMGSRKLRDWILQPLQDPEAISERQNAVEELLHEDELPFLLKEIRDLKRLITKIATLQASPKDLFSLKLSLQALPKIQEKSAQFTSPLLKHLHHEIDLQQALYETIAKTLSDDPPMKLSDGNCIRTGFDPALDELKSLKNHSEEWLQEYQIQLREQTGIKTLRVGFTRVSGFYIEVSRGQSEKAPESFIRRQTLTNAERYITHELKAYEDKVLRADEQALEIETRLFRELCITAALSAPAILQTAEAIATIDALYSLARAARQNRYTRPLVDDSSMLFIAEGRHPVIEKTLLNEPFTANDTHLDGKEKSLMLITGPNMAGKSTYIRQTALIVLLAHIGSFVPAEKAHIGIVDQLFTRIGANDDLARGQSTFMVEMTETAAILHKATSKSLVILDEIGRGTSTYDGISLAWSIAEFLLNTPHKQAKTLFATHYFELTRLEQRFPRAVNYNVAVLEEGDHVVFLRKIIRGSADRSYGIHVARLAGLPAPVLKRAQEILHLLEEKERQPASSSKGKKTPSTKAPSREVQILLNF